MRPHQDVEKHTCHEKVKRIWDRGGEKESTVNDLRANKTIRGRERSDLTAVIASNNNKKSYCGREIEKAVWVAALHVRAMERKGRLNGGLSEKNRKGGFVAQ